MERKEIRQYCKRIEKHLLCPKAARDRFLLQTRQAIDEYLSEDPAASLSDVQAFLGEPTEVAANCMLTLEQSEIFAYQKKCRRNTWLVLVCSILAVTIIGGMLAVVWNNSREPVIVKRTIIDYGDIKTETSNSNP